jgi:hypothetical protein
MPLSDVQTKLSGWIRAPEGVAQALAEEDAKEAGTSPGPARQRLERLVRSDGKLDAVGRLEIYANAYFHRIHGVLRDDYPALAGGLGADLFRDLVTSYLLVRPSRHPSLRHVGARLPGFIASHAAAAGLRERAPWAADLAAFEWARVDVFDAADRPLLTRDEVAARSPESFGELPLRLGPWVRLARFEHPVARLWRQGCDGEIPASNAWIDPAPMLVWRRDERVVHRRVEALEEAALLLAQAATSFGSLCEWLATRMDESAAPRQAARWLEQWLSDGLLVAVEALDGRASAAPIAPRSG